MVEKKMSKRKESGKDKLNINFNNSEEIAGRSIVLTSLNHSVQLASADPHDSIDKLANLASSLMVWMHEEIT